MPCLSTDRRRRKQILHSVSDSISAEKSLSLKIPFESRDTFVRFIDNITQPFDNIRPKSEINQKSETGNHLISVRISGFGLRIFNMHPPH